MPKNSKTSVIQKIASQACHTFRNIPSSAGFQEQHTELMSLVSLITAPDLNISPPKKLSTSSKKSPSSSSSSCSSSCSSSAPVTYMHICETDTFSMGVFLLKPGASIPLHDHPDMYGMLKVLYGKVNIRCYDKLDKSGGHGDGDDAGDDGGDGDGDDGGGDDGDGDGDDGGGDDDGDDGDGGGAENGDDGDDGHGGHGDGDDGHGGHGDGDGGDDGHGDDDGGADAELQSQDEAVSPAVLRSSGQFSAQSGPCVLSPSKDNLHQIDAVDGPAAFLDILAPPYDPDDGRDCHYYKVLRTAVRKEQSHEDEAWLLEIPQPDDFWCGGEPYPGPQVSV